MRNRRGFLITNRTSDKSMSIKGIMKFEPLVIVRHLGFEVSELFETHSWKIGNRNPTILIYISSPIY